MKRLSKPTKRASPEKIPAKKMPRSKKPKEAKKMETKTSSSVMDGLSAYRLAGVDAMLDKASSRAIDVGDFSAVKEFLQMKCQIGPK